MTRKKATDSEVNEDNAYRKFSKIAKQAGLRGFGDKGQSQTNKQVVPRTTTPCKKVQTQPTRSSPRKQLKNKPDAAYLEKRQKQRNDVLPRRLEDSNSNVLSQKKRDTQKQRMEEEVVIQEEDDEESNSSSEEEGVSETQFPAAGTHTQPQKPPPSTGNEKQKIEVMVYRHSFEPNITKDINKIVISCWRGPYINWNQVPQDVKDVWWEEFAQKFSWGPMLENDVNKLFKKKCAAKIRNVISRAKVNLKKPSHVSIEDWAKMKELFNDEKYKAKCDKVKVFRAKYSQEGGSTYCGGSTSAHEHRKKLEMELKRPASVLEVFNVTHKKKGGTYSGKRAEKIAADFLELQREEREKGDQSGDKKTDEELWVEATGGPVNGRVFGIGFVGHGRCYNIGSSALEIKTLQNIVMQRDEIIVGLQAHAVKMDLVKTTHETTISDLHMTLNGVLSYLHDPSRGIPAHLTSLMTEPTLPQPTIPQPLPLQLQDSDETQP